MFPILLLLWCTGQRSPLSVCPIGFSAEGPKLNHHERLGTPGIRRSRPKQLSCFPCGLFVFGFSTMTNSSVRLPRTKLWRHLIH